MADSWAERRGRMVKCKTHGLHFDPEMSTGCTLCLRDAAKARRQESRPPQLVLILLCLLGMAAILLYLFGPGRSRTTAPPDLGVAIEPAVVQKLDPEPYRGPIMALESVLFRTPLDETEDLLLISDETRLATEELSAAILRGEPVHGLETADLIARVGQGIPADQVTVTDVDRARLQWTRLRQQRFQEAAWFSPPAGSGEPDAVAASEYSAAAASLRALLEDGAAEAEALYDPAGVPAGGGDDPAFRWRVFARDWLADLDDLGRRLSARPGADAPNQLLLAVQELERALDHARALATSAQPPDAADPRFDEAINAALRAQQSFDDLGV